MFFFKNFSDVFFFSLTKIFRPYRCLGIIRFEIRGLQGKLWRRTWSNQLLKILLIKKFSNDSDFHFHIPIHEILDQKSLYGRKNFISEKKKMLLNFLEKSNFFQNQYWGGTVEELFAYIFGNYIKKDLETINLSSVWFGVGCNIGWVTSAYRVLQTIQMKLILICVWAERAVLGSAKTLKFK